MSLVFNMAAELDRRTWAMLRDAVAERLEAAPTPAGEPVFKFRPEIAVEDIPPGQIVDRMFILGAGPVLAQGKFTCGTRDVLYTLYVFATRLLTPEHGEMVQRDELIHDAEIIGRWLPADGWLPQGVMEISLVDMDFSYDLPNGGPPELRKHATAEWLYTIVTLAVKVRENSLNP